MVNGMKMIDARLRVVVLTIFIVSVVLAFVSVSNAQGSVPENGTFSGNTNGWYYGGGSYSGSVGHDANGSLYLTTSEGAVTQAFILGSGSSLTFWVRGNSCSSSSAGEVWIRDLTNSVAYDLGDVSATSNTWVEVTRDLSGYVGVYGQLEISGSVGCSIYIDDVSITNATQVLPRVDTDINGSFSATSFYWLRGKQAVFAVYNAVDGHNNAGALSSVSPLSDIESGVFEVSHSSWSMWVRCVGPSTCSYQLYVLDYDGGTYSLVSSDSLSYSTDWTEKTFSLGGYYSHRVMFQIVGTNFQIDDICNVACLEGTVTPTITLTPTIGATATPTSSGGATATPTSSGGATATPTSGGGDATATPSSGGSGDDCDFNTPNTCHVVVDNFPTQIAPLTQVPYPTQLPYPTPMYGLNTPAPVYVPTPQVTAIAANSGGVTSGSLDDLAQTSDFSEVPPIDIQSGSSDFPIHIGVQVQNVTVCLPTEITAAVSLADLCYSFALFVIPELRIGSHDFGIYLELIAAVLVFVFFVRQIQEH